MLIGMAPAPGRYWSGTVQHLCLGTQNLRHKTSKLMVFHSICFITIYCASAKQSLELEREWKQCEAQILVRYTFCVYPPQSLSQSLTPCHEWTAQRRARQWYRQRLWSSTRKHHEYVTTSGPCSTLAEVPSAAGLRYLRRAPLWCREWLDSGWCWVPGSMTELFIKCRVCLNRKL